MKLAIGHTIINKISAKANTRPIKDEPALNCLDIYSAKVGSKEVVPV